MTTTTTTVTMKTMGDDDVIISIVFEVLQLFFEANLCYEFARVRVFLACLL